MALTVGELQVVIEAQTTQFTSALRVLDRRMGKFTRSQNTQLKTIKSSFIGIKGAVLGIVSAFGAFAAIRGLVTLGKEAVEAAGSFEALEVQLKSFLGTQQEASLALDDFIELASKTPFTVQQITRAGAALGAVALGNREALRELTFQAVNIAAVTGLGVAEAAANLQRAVQNGIASADLFREKGVKPLIEAVLGIPDLLSVPIEEVGEAFAEAFGTGGVFADAAEALSFTLSGALSNIDDAATNTKAALGATFSPGIIGGAREFLIPLLKDMQKAIEANSKQLVDLAFNGFRAFAEGVTTGLRVISFFLNGLAETVAFVDRVKVSLLRFNLVLANIDPFTDDERIAKLTAELAKTVGQAVKTEEALALIAAQSSLAADAAALLSKNFNKLNIDEFVLKLKDAQKTSDEFQKAVQSGQDKKLLDAKQLVKDESALKSIEGAVTRISDARLGDVDPLLKQTAALDRQLVALQAIQRTSENGARIDAANLALVEERLRVADALVDATDRQAAGQTKVQGLLGQLGRLDPEEADDLAADFADAFNSARGAEARAEVAEDFAIKVQDALDEVRPEFPGVAESFASGVSGALRAALTGETENFGRAFGEILQSEAETNLLAAFDSALAELRNGLEDAFANVGSLLDLGGGGDSFLGGLFGGSGEGFGSKLGSALGDIAGTVGPALISAALSDDTFSATAGSIQSAVTSTQAVRGVVAGPTSIGIAQVARGIRDANAESERLLGLIERNTRRTADQSGIPTLPGVGGDEATDILTNQSESLV